MNARQARAMLERMQKAMPPPPQPPPLSPEEQQRRLADFIREVVRADLAGEPPPSGHPVALAIVQRRLPRLRELFGPEQEQALASGEAAREQTP